MKETIEERSKNNSLRQDADYIMQKSIEAVLPDEAVRKALENKQFNPDGKIYLCAAGKAAWQMAEVAAGILEGKIEDGVVCTKYGHVKKEIPGIRCYEGGHPVLDSSSIKATKAAEDLVKDLKPEDTVLFLLSGGGSALFEDPLISLDEMKDITGQLLKSGADIVEMNTIRKRLSKVKGGRFARLCEPASVCCIILSDILGDPLDMIASGPACPDSSTCEQALAIAEKYNLKLSPEARKCLEAETPKQLDHVETAITGSVKYLCKAAVQACADLGYKAQILTDCLQCEARDAGSFLGSIAHSHANSDENLAFIAGGETVVHVKGTGKGGRNQEIALAAANQISGLDNAAVFSFGSDGTDGPTDAAGGYSDGNTARILTEQNTDIYTYLQNNDAYHALEKTGGLIKTGATGTNVNDVSVVLIQKNLKRSK